MKAYVINLESRTDRWESVGKQWADRPEVLVRIDAVNSISISSAQTQFLPNPVVANWLSQCKAFREFLRTDDQYALILEDDFLLSKIELGNCLDLVKVGRLDFLQLGYLYNSYSDFLFIKITNFRDLILKLINRGSKHFRMRFSNRLLVREQSDVNFRIVLNSAGAGSHAYIISRKFAEEMLQINDPVFLAADGLFIAIANLRFLKMGRLRVNRVKQSNSPSSITKRFVN